MPSTKLTATPTRSVRGSSGTPKRKPWDANTLLHSPFFGTLLTLLLSAVVIYLMRRVGKVEKVVRHLQSEQPFSDLQLHHQLEQHAQQLVQQPPGITPADLQESVLPLVQQSHHELTEFIRQQQIVIEHLSTEIQHLRQALFAPQRETPPVILPPTTPSPAAAPLRVLEREQVRRPQISPPPTSHPQVEEEEEEEEEEEQEEETQSEHDTKELEDDNEEFEDASEQENEEEEEEEDSQEEEEDEEEDAPSQVAFWPSHAFHSPLITRPPRIEIIDSGSDNSPKQQELKESSSLDQLKASSNPIIVNQSDTKGSQEE